MSQNNRYMAVSVTEPKADTKRPKVGGQSRGTGVQDASVAALERELAIYKRDSGIEMEELRAKVNNMPKGGGAGEPGKDGVGIESVEQTVVSEESGGENKVEITLTDGQKTEVVIRNGKDGKDGEGGGEGGNVTPESIGAVKKSGDTMTGQLSLPSLRVTNYGTPLEMGKYLDMHNPNSPDDDFSVRLIADGDTLKMQRKGVGALDVFYHTNNKPTADAVGALKRGSYERIQGTAEAHKNLNDYVLPGFYNVKTAYVDNCPSGIGGDAVLLVYPWNDNIYNMQEITETAASPKCRRWTRHSNAGTWTAWKAVITEDSKNLITASDVGAIDAFVGNINGTDIKFDTAFAQGEYQVASNNETSDTPPYALNGGYAYGKLIVTISDGGSYNGQYNWMWQTYYPTSGGAPYIRSKINNGAFSSWQRIATTDYIDEQILKGEW